jgi:transcriptional regulator with XRE-family HTH domain
MSETSSSAQPEVRFPNRIAHLRHRARLKVVELARIVGVSRRHVSSIEAGEKVPSAALLYDIAEALTVPLQELFEEEWSMTRRMRVQEARSEIFDD